MANLFKSLATGMRRGIMALGVGTSNEDVMLDLLPEKDSFGGTRTYVIELLSKAQAGDPQSMFFLAMDYRPGGVIRTDPVKAAKWM